MSMYESIEYFPIFNPETTAESPGLSAAVGSGIAAIGAPDALGGAGAVVLVEGEKTADAAGAMFRDLVAVTWPGGSNAIAKADFSALNRRDVIIWPDADAPGLRDTPRRYLAALAEMTSGRHADIKGIMASQFECEGCDLVEAEGIRFSSVCPHHLLPYSGTVAIRYRPAGRVLGLSKIARVVDGNLTGNADWVIDGAATLPVARPGEITLADHPRLVGAGLEAAAFADDFRGQRDRRDDRRLLHRHRNQHVVAGTNAQRA